MFSCIESLKTLPPFRETDFFAKMKQHPISLIQAKVFNMKEVAISLEQFLHKRCALKFLE